MKNKTCSHTAEHSGSSTKFIIEPKPRGNRAGREGNLGNEEKLCEKRSKPRNPGGGLTGTAWLSKTARSLSPLCPKMSQLSDSRKLVPFRRHFVHVPNVFHFHFPPSERTKRKKKFGGKIKPSLSSSKELGNRESTLLRQKFSRSFRNGTKSVYSGPEE